MKCYFLVFFFATVLAKDVQLKKYVLNLDAPAKDRWREIASDYKQAVTDVLNGFIEKMTPDVFDMMTVLASAVAQEIPTEYEEELSGFAETINVTLGEMIVFNMLYEMTAYDDSNSRACTSIVATLPNGQVIHGRNLDYGVEGLNHMAVMVDFQKGGKTTYVGTTFAGYIGLMTGMRPNKFTVSLDERDKGQWTQNDQESAKLGPKGVVAFVIRDLLASDSADFEGAVKTLSSAELIAPCYIIVGGLKDDEGAVITRNRTQAIDVWRLDNKAKRWFLVETNYDHWVAPPKEDDRRDPANKMMSALEEKKLDSDALFKVLSTPPVDNDGTKYTTIMSASNPELYSTWARHL